MDGEIERVRREVAELADGHGRRYPADLKREIVNLAKRLRARGMGWQKIADALGVPTVKTFIEELSSESEFVPVQIVKVSSPSSMTVTSPSGYRVDGLSIGEVAELLRQLA